jgi:hypothetical protein
MRSLKKFNHKYLTKQESEKLTLLCKKLLLRKENVNNSDLSDKFQYHPDTLKTDLEKQSLDELNHAKKLGDRIIQLGAMLLNEEPLTLPVA